MTTNDDEPITLDELEHRFLTKSVQSDRRNIRVEAFEMLRAMQRDKFRRNISYLLLVIAVGIVLIALADPARAIQVWPITKDLLIIALAFIAGQKIQTANLEL